MKLGLTLGYWGSGPPPGLIDQVAAVERLGFDSIWTAEAYGSDAFTPLAWLGAHTRHVKLATSIVQLSARTPTATAMAAMTLDHLSEGRMMLGLGPSGPQVVEGWYGRPYPMPLARTREYVGIVRDVIAREKVTNDGEHYPLPYPGGTGLGKPLRSTLHPRRTDGRKDEAIAAVPTPLVEKVALIGPRAKIAEELAAWEDSLVTTMLVGGETETLATMAELAGIEPRE